jgi:putative acyl-CoA dehydrogenase
VIGAAAGMRQALVNATHHARYRSAFGRLLIQQPLMQNVLADLALESEAATILALRLARAHEQAAHNPQEMALKRLGTAIAKYWTTKRAPIHAAEALECLGGNGYVEESIMPRLYREAPLNSIWEGSGNVNCLDVLRAMHKEPHTVEAFFAEIAPAQSLDPRLDQSVQRLQRELADPTNIETRARRLVEHMALVLQASLLLQHSPAFISDTFCASRLANDWGHAFGTLPPTTDFPAIIDRAFPPTTI